MRAVGEKSPFHSLTQSAILNECKRWLRQSCKHCTRARSAQHPNELYDSLFSLRLLGGVNGTVPQRDVTSFPEPSACLDVRYLKQPSKRLCQRRAQSRGHHCHSRRNTGGGHWTGRSRNIFATRARRVKGKVLY